ncbi:MAG: poly[(R)-3-hydroxyalkanoate] polymerase subunit PhaC [Sphingomonadales bacterium]|nr:poly[(R)-3-hydroxyalkanoate] polymerase subunit PhaC [Sphingomonadales bacterium]
MKAALEGLRKYQEAKRPAPPAPMPAIADAHGAALRDYGGEGRPVLFVPSLINPPNVLDMGDRSLLRWLAGQGRRVLLLDWGWPGPDRRAMSVAGHVEQILLPLMEKIGEPADLVGYCLGGTMALAAARPGAARSVATIAAPWYFNGFPNESRVELGKLWAGARATATTLGVLPMEVLQCAFWNLDPARTVAKFEAFAGLEGAEARTFVMLEDWANDGPPLSEAAAREMFEDLFGDDLTGAARWRVAGATVDPESLTVPLLNIVSTTDRIVPAASAVRAGERIDLALGHVGMVVGSRAPDMLWQPLAGWLSRTAASC